MKKIYILLVLFFTVLAQAATAQEGAIAGVEEDYEDMAVAAKKKGVSAPIPVDHAFTSQYNNARDVEWDWQQGQNLYVVNFKTNGRDRSAAYTPSGKWLRTETYMVREQLPLAVNVATVKGEYKSWEMSDFAEVVVGEQEKVYRVKAQKGAETLYLFYSPDGKLIEKKNTI